MALARSVVAAARISGFVRSWPVPAEEQSRRTVSTDLAVKNLLVAVGLSVLLVVGALVINAL